MFEKNIVKEIIEVSKIDLQIKEYFDMIKPTYDDYIKHKKPQQLKPIIQLAYLIGKQVGVNKYYAEDEELKKIYIIKDIINNKNHGAFTLEGASVFFKKSKESILKSILYQKKINKNYIIVEIKVKGK